MGAFCCWGVRSNFPNVPVLPIANTARVHSAGGMTSTFLTSPLDVVKTRLQSDFYKHQLEAKRLESGAVVRGGVVHQGLRHFKETFQILGCARAGTPPGA